MRHQLSISVYGGLIASILNYANFATYSIPSIQLGFILTSFLTGFLITYLALLFHSLAGPLLGLGGLLDIFEFRHSPSISQPPISNKKIFNKKTSEAVTNK